MLYLIGVGFKPGDITVEGLEIAGRCDEVYFESYTSIYDKPALRKVVGFKELSREQVEDGSFVQRAKDRDVALLVPGDPLVATTHISIFVSARNADVPVKVIHAPSIYSAVAETGLHIYKFGKTTTIPTHKKDYRPTSFLETIRNNLEIGAHTLVLLDIGMSLSTGCEMLGELGEIDVVALHLGTETRIAYGPPHNVSKLNFEQPCCIVVPADLHFTEEEFLNLYKV